MLRNPNKARCAVSGCRSVAQHPERSRGAAEILTRSVPKGSGAPFRTLLTLDRVLDGLIDCVATQLFHQELDEALAPISPLEREGVQRNIDRLAARASPREALIVLRRCRRDLEKKRGSGNN